MEEKREVVVRLGQVCERKGIGVAVLDVDDTLWNVKDLFTKRIQGASRIIEKESGVDRSEVESRIRKIIAELESEMNVNPARIVLSTELTGRWCGLGREDRAVKSAVEYVVGVYDDTPVVFEGVPEMIGQFQRVGVRVVGVTQADEVWNRKKLWGTGMSGRLDGLACAPVDEPKGVSQWRRAYDRLDVDSKMTVVIGDNYNKDIVPNMELGVRNLVLVLNGRSRPEAVADRVLVVEKTGGVIRAMLESW